MALCIIGFIFTNHFRHLRLGEFLRSMVEVCEGHGKTPQTQDTHLFMAHWGSPSPFFSIREYSPDSHGTQPSIEKTPVGDDALFWVWSDGWTCGCSLTGTCPAEIPILVIWQSFFPPCWSQRESITTGNIFIFPGDLSEWRTQVRPFVGCQRAEDCGDL